MVVVPTSNDVTLSYGASAELPGHRGYIDRTGRSDLVVRRTVLAALAHCHPPAGGYDVSCRVTPVPAGASPTPTRFADGQATLVTSAIPPGVAWVPTWSPRPPLTATARSPPPDRSGRYHRRRRRARPRLTEQKALSTSLPSAVVRIGTFNEPPTMRRFFGGRACDAVETRGAADELVLHLPARAAVRCPHDLPVLLAVTKCLPDNLTRRGRRAGDIGGRDTS